MKPVKPSYSINAWPSVTNYPISLDPDTGLAYPWSEQPAAVDAVTRYFKPNTAVPSEHVNALIKELLALHTSEKTQLTALATMMAAFPAQNWRDDQLVLTSGEIHGAGFAKAYNTIVSGGYVSSAGVMHMNRNQGTTWTINSQAFAAPSKIINPDVTVGTLFSVPFDASIVNYLEAFTPGTNTMGGYASFPSTFCGSDATFQRGSSTQRKLIFVGADSLGSGASYIRVMTTGSSFVSEASPAIGYSGTDGPCLAASDATVVAYRKGLARSSAGSFYTMAYAASAWTAVSATPLLASSSDAIVSMCWHAEASLWLAVVKTGAGAYILFSSSDLATWTDRYEFTANILTTNVSKVGALFSEGSMLYALGSGKGIYASDPELISPLYSRDAGLTWHQGPALAPVDGVTLDGSFSTTNSWKNALPCLVSTGGGLALVTNKRIVVSSVLGDPR